MEAYKVLVVAQGYNVIHIRHERDKRTEDSLNYLTKKGFDYFISYESFDWSLEKRIKDFCLENTLNLEIKKNQISLTNSYLAEEIIKEPKICGMRKFYKKQRQDLNILIERDGSPTGGEWSFDKMNRKKLPSKIIVPSVPAIKKSKYLIKAIEEVSMNYKDYYGSFENFNSRF